MKTFSISWTLDAEVIASILSYMLDEYDESMPTNRKGVEKAVRKYLERFGNSVSESMPCNNKESIPLLRKLYPEWAKELEGL
jgi:hypothetical protein